MSQTGFQQTKDWQWKEEGLARPMFVEEVFEF
jgi:hypothetical protein